jgi:hypothetical protein
MYLDAGGDSQWYGSKLLWAGTNPYTEALDSSDWFKTAYPNYAHILYFALFPLTLFEWEASKIVWFFFNVTCFLFTLYAFVRYEKVEPYSVLILASLMLLGSTFANTLYQGQLSILIFSWVSLAWIFRMNSVLLVIFLSLIFSKYSFGLPILLGFFLAGYFKETVGAFLLNLLFALVFAYKFDLGFLESISLPFKVASVYTSGHGHSDLLTLFRLGTPNESFFGINYFSIGAFAIYAVFAYICLVHRPHKKLIVVSSLLLSFPVLFHLPYDYVVLLAPIIIGLSHPALSKKSVSVLTALSVYFWIYPILPKFLRTLFHVNTGIHPMDYFGPTFGKVFILFNIMLLVSAAFIVLQDTSSKDPALKEVK